MIIENIRELSTLEFTVGSITAKSYCWQGGTEIDYTTLGRNMNLIQIVTSGVRSYHFDGENFTVGEGTVLLIPHATRYRT